MELLVEVAHGAGRSTDVVLEVEPGATFGDVADALGVPRPPRRHAVDRPHRPDAAPRRPRRRRRRALRRPADARRLGQRRLLGDARGVRRHARRDLAERRGDRAPAALRRQPPRSRLRQRRRHQGPAGVPPPRPHHRHRRRHDRRPRLEERRRHRRHGDHHADRAATRADGRDRRPDAVDPRPRPRRRSPGVEEPHRVQPPTAGHPAVRRGRGRAAGAARPAAPPAPADDQRRPAGAPRHRHVLPHRPDRGDLHAAVADPPHRQRDRGPAHRAARVQGGARRARHGRRRAGPPPRAAAGRGGAQPLPRAARRRPSSAASCAACPTGCGSGRPATRTSCACGSARPSCRRGRRSRWPAVGPGTCAASWRRSPAASASSTTCRSPSTCSHIGGVGLAGPMASTRALARSMVVQAATMHSPTDLAVVALVGEGGLTDWTFLKWLPHSRSLGGSQLASTSHHALVLVNAPAAGQDRQRRRVDPAGRARRDRRDLPGRAPPPDAADRGRPRHAASPSCG